MMRWALAAAALALFGATRLALAQPWPAKPLHLIVALPAGSGADIVARVIASRLGARIGESVVVENRPGAAENIGMAFAARSAPDGYTLLLAVTSLVTNPHLYKLSYDPLQDFVAVAQLAKARYVLVVRDSLPANSVQELLRLARSEPGKLTCAHASGALHIACAWLKQQAQLDITLVPYKGSVQALNDVVAGQADMIFAVMHTAVPQVKAGRVRALATTDAERRQSPFGVLPTLAEILPGLVLESWLGLVAPAGAPQDIVSRLNSEVNAVLTDPEVREQLSAGGLEPSGGTAAAFAALIRRDYEKYADIIRRTGIRAE